MKIYDISQEVFSCKVFPGDPVPELETVLSINNGDICNLSSFSMCAHNGTHIDAPCHFINGAQTVDQIPLEKLVGYCYVAAHTGEVTAEDAEEMLKLAPERARSRILIKGKATVSLPAAKVFAKRGVCLVGNESQTVGPEDAPMQVHMELLSAKVVLLEGIRLAHVPEGEYLLNCAPLCLGSADGAPCRAVLIKE